MLTAGGPWAGARPGYVVGDATNHGDRASAEDRARFSITLHLIDGIGDKSLGNVAGVSPF
jgi:hypothetical protein